MHSAGTATAHDNPDCRQAMSVIKASVGEKEHERNGNWERSNQDLLTHSLSKVRGGNNRQ